MRDRFGQRFDDTPTGSLSSGWLLAVAAITVVAVVGFLVIAYWPRTPGVGVVAISTGPATVGSAPPEAPTPLHPGALASAPRTEPAALSDDGLCQSQVQNRTLINKFGREPKSATGSLDYCRSEAGALRARVKLGNLFPQSIYQLTLNGTPGLPGNEQLRQQCGAHGSDGYCDCRTVLTSGAGGVDERFHVDLPAGEYRVKFFVKNLNREPRDEVVLLSEEVQFAVSGGRFIE